MSTLPMLAGFASTVLFAASTLPMLLKAVRTRDLASYSAGNLVLANVGNLVHSVYVFHLPPGPIWLLHSFYLATSALTLAWYLRYAAGLRISTHSPDPQGASSDRREDDFSVHNVAAPSPHARTP